MDSKAPFPIAPIARLLLAGMLCPMLAGCDRLFSQKSGDALDRAREKEKEGDYQAAIQWYEESLDGTAKTAEAHYDMALLFDDKLDDAVAALDHFRRYLALEPDGEHASDAKNFAEQDEFKLVNILSKGNFMPQQDAARLKNQNIDLQQQIDELRKELTDLRTSMVNEMAGHPRGADPVPSGSRTYEVQPGDTLSSISRMFYKTSARWHDIRDANITKLGGSVKLKVGMVLVIPRD
ncbi:MAG: LysM peptidoglycan-binding domain-containing protein [Chthoniobacteraceae bacterium]|jgi:nucleoid-associated protein YgaU